MIVACTNLIAAAGGTLGKCWRKTPDSSTVLFLCLDHLRPQMENELILHKGKIFFCHEFDEMFSVSVKIRRRRPCPHVYDVVNDDFT